MKKNYLKPETVMVDVVLCNIIASSVGFGDRPTGPKDAGQSRGEWGNVWGK